MPLRKRKVPRSARDDTWLVRHSVRQTNVVIPSAARDLCPLQGRQRGEGDAEVFLVQTVDLAVHHVEEDEAVEPAHQIVLAHAHAHVGRAAADGSSNSLLGLRLCRSGMIRLLVANSSAWPET